MIGPDKLNADSHAAGLDQEALVQAVRAQGEAWHNLVTERCPYLFAAMPVYISPAQLRKMYEVIAAVERVVGLPGWLAAGAEKQPHSKGVFFGYDFHLNEQGVHLIEINSNAGGAFLTELLADSQRDADLPGKTVAIENLEPAFLAMFRNEWRLERGSAPLNSIAIVDENPEQQYLYPEFVLARNMLERDGLTVYIADPVALKTREDGLYFGSEKIDMVYNRLTDFSLQQFPALKKAYENGRAVVTPHPHAYAKYADKRNLARLTDETFLRALNVDEADIVTLQAGVPHTFIVNADMETALWADRKNLFFKPHSGYGSRGTYRGMNLTKRVFAEIVQGNYVAQMLAPPGERMVRVNEAEEVSLKYDVRCYVYAGKIQLVVARLYQGQTTNMRTPGGGFALVRVVE
ncbi:MAG TPA: hypothetical protein VMV88_06280 [Gallionella sp.]|nr:hypothetical protein [Gallionella sp.]